MEHWQSEWELFLERKDFPSEEESKREKRLGKPGRNSWIPGKDELDTLSHGITEKEEETNCSVGNPHHHGSLSMNRMETSLDIVQASTADGLRPLFVVVVSIGVVMEEIVGGTDIPLSSRHSS